MNEPTTHAAQIARRRESMRFRGVHDRFYTKRGWMTAYGLSCGYIESHRVGMVSVDMQWVSSGVYQVRLFDFDEIDTKLDHRSRVDFFTPSIKEARKKFLAYQNYATRRCAERCLGLPVPKLNEVQL